MNRKQSPSDDPDLEALRRCRQGERRAFAEIVDRHKNGVFRLVYRWLGHKERAEELAQEVFLKAYRELERFRGDAKFSTWLYQIALNACRDDWRSRRRRPETRLDPEFLNAQPAPAASPEADLIAGSEAESLRRALDGLPEIYREALLLRYFGDLSYEEMAEHSGEGISNLKMRVARGLAQLRRRLERQP